MCAIEMVMKIMHYMSKSGVICKDMNQDLNFQLCVSMIHFLRFATKNSEINSYFVIQWYTMLKNIILSTEIPNEIKLDILLKDLLDKSNMQT